MKVVWTEQALQGLLEIEEYIAQIRGMVGGEEIGKSISYTIQMIIDAIMRSYIANPMTAF